ncbi:MAG: hypothetical protein ABDH91_09120 [Bacteroidia bacterium]
MVETLIEEALKILMHPKPPISDSAWARFYDRLRLYLGVSAATKAVSKTEAL